MRFNPEYFMLDNLINDVLMLFYETAKQKSLSIKTDISPNTQAFADKSMISTVLRNLISNAIKFSLPEGTISIIVEEHKKELKVKVCDTGIGIPKESIGRLFRIDQNRSTPGTQNEQGTGLGLILCKEFIEKHGGIIGVESNHDGEKESKGSTFYFTIPPEFK
jgi:signal transduction histidine kinase